MRRPVVLLTWLTLLLLSSAAFALTIEPYPGGRATGDLMRDPSLVVPEFLSGAVLAPNHRLFSSSDEVVLSGTTGMHVAFDHFFGASGENLTFGLDFAAGGVITYDYAVPLTVSYQAPAEAIRGDSFRIDPFLDLRGAPTLSSSQDLLYMTNFVFDLFVDMPFPIPNIDVDVEWAVPDVNLSSGFLDTNGSGSIETETSNYVDQLASDDGRLTIETDRGSTPAWAAGIDLIAVAADYLLPMEIVDWLGFDLDVTLGMPILRQDSLTLLNFSFEEAVLEIPDYYAGDTFQQLVTTQLTYDLAFVSTYYYGGTLSMSFDGPFFSPQELFGESLGSFEVATKNLVIQQNIDVGFMVDVDVVDALSSGFTSFAPIPVPPALRSIGSLYPSEYSSGTTASKETLPTVVATDEFVQHYQAAVVPEPGTMLLLGSGLLGLAGFQRRRR